jgi:hypothetical protein
MRTVVEVYVCVRACVCVRRCTYVLRPAAWTTFLDVKGGVRACVCVYVRVRSQCTVGWCLRCVYMFGE